MEIDSPAPVRWTLYFLFPGFSQIPSFKDLILDKPLAELPPAPPIRPKPRPTPGRKAVPSVIIHSERPRPRSSTSKASKAEETKTPAPPLFPKPGAKMSSRKRSTISDNSPDPVAKVCLTILHHSYFYSYWFHSVVDLYIPLYLRAMTTPRRLQDPLRSNPTKRPTPTTNLP